MTNGLGGYASGTVAGVITRRYHGLLIAALPAPLGRMVMLSHVAEQFRFADGRRVEIGGRERSRRRAGRARHRLPHRVPARGRAAGVALRRRGPRPRKAAVPAAHAEHGAPHCTSCCPAPTRVELGAAPVGELPRAGGAGQRAARRGRTNSAPVGGHFEICADGQPAAAAAAAAVAASDARVHAEGRCGSTTCCIRSRRAAAIRRAAICGARATSS